MGPHGLKSVTHERDLDEFLNTAQLAATDFTAGLCTGSYAYACPHRTYALFFSPLPEKQNVKIISAVGVGASSAANPFLLSAEEELDALSKHSQYKKALRVPRRPPWTKDMTAKEVDKQEKEAFLEWRRSLAQ